MTSGGPVASSEPDLTDPGGLAHWTSEKVRFQDIDRLDHVNNVAIAAYAESGRVEFLEAIAPDSLQRTGASYWVIAQLNIRFHAEARFPGTIDIGTCVLRIGNSSVTLGQGMFSDGRCIATTESVVVLVDPATGKGRELGDTLRADLAAYRR